MFFYVEQINQETYSIIENLFGKEADEAGLENIDNENKELVQSSVMAELNRFIEDDFKQRWSWIELAMQVAKESLTSYFEVVDKPVLAVLTLASYLQDKVQLIESRTKK